MCFFKQTTSSFRSVELIVFRDLEQFSLTATMMMMMIQLAFGEIMGLHIIIRFVVSSLSPSSYIEHTKSVDIGIG